MIDYKAKFEQILADIQVSRMFVNMSNTVENSPWHREANVRVHTNMVVAEYTKSVPREDWSSLDFVGALACLFHDTGKPEARTEKHSETRGTYFSYHGHELISARLWEAWNCAHLVVKDQFEANLVGWMIQNHMPWELKNKEKLINMKLHVNLTNSLDTFKRVLLADQRGRTADDHSTKLQKVAEWIDMFDSVDAPITLIQPYRSADLIMHLPIAPSGAGKSTLFNHLISQYHKELRHFSLDALRHQLYDVTDYSKAFEQSVNDPNFQSKANHAFIAAITDCKTAGSDLYIDNTNLTPKRRQFYITEARKRGYVIIGHLMPSCVDVVISRQSTRKDKHVPGPAVYKQYMSLVLPTYGEVDNIMIHTNNILQ